jgi:rubrerythrin
MEQPNLVDDILDFAIGNEIEAYKFYTDLAAKVSNPVMQKVFLDFAAEEQAHRKLLEDVKREKKIKLDNKQITNLKIAEFTIAAQPTPDMDYQAILVLAMQKEKKSFKLYTRMAELVTNAENKKLFEFLARQEAKHKLRFELEYDEIVLKED